MEMESMGCTSMSMHEKNCMCEECTKYREEKQLPDSIKDGIVDRMTMEREPWEDRGMSDT